MRCEQFEKRLQRLLDRRALPSEDAGLNRHAARLSGVPPDPRRVRPHARRAELDGTARARRRLSDARRSQDPRCADHRPSRVGVSLQRGPRSQPDWRWPCCSGSLGTRTAPSPVPHPASWLLGRRSRQPRAWSRITPTRTTRGVSEATTRSVSETTAPARSSGKELSRPPRSISISNRLSSCCALGQPPGPPAGTRWMAWRMG